MKLNRKLVLILSLVLSLALATGGTLAYLTDRDSAANVFTIGNVDIDLNEDFDQGAELIPGVDIEKEATITNTGKNDAWVWATVAIPAALDDDDASKNVVHFNYPKDNVGEGLWTWTKDNKWMVEKDVEHDGVYYNVYTVLYQTALKPGETTPAVINNVYMDTAVDIAPDGEMYKVVKGEATKVGWNVNTNGNPVIYVSAYAMQKDGFDSVQDAYDAYNTQWTTEGGVNNGIEWGKPGVTVTSDDELLAAIQDKEVTTIFVDGELTYDWGRKSYENSEALLLSGKTFVGADDEASITFKGYGSANPIKNATFNSITIKDETVGDNESSWEHGYLEFVGLTAKNVVFADPIMLDGTCTLTDCTVDNQQASWYGVWVEGGNVTFNGCTFTGTRAIKVHEAYGTEVASVVVDDCSFTLSEKPGVAIGNLNADTSVTITDSTFETQPGDQNKYIYETDTDVSAFTFAESGNTVK